MSPLQSTALRCVLLGMCFCCRVVHGHSSANDDPILYPKRISVPTDIPSVEEVEYRDKDGIARSSVILPTVRYLEGHYSGWQSCLRQAMSGGLEHSRKGRVPAPASFESYTYQGMKDGHKACLKHLETLIENGLSEADLADYCERAHRPIRPNRPKYDSQPSRDEAVPEEGSQLPFGALTPRDAMQAAYIA